MMKKLVELLLLSQEELLAHISGIYAPLYTKQEFEGGIVFIPKNVEKYPLMCAHLDTINTHRKTPLERSDLYINKDYIGLPTSTKKACLGGDDRCGVYIALELLASGLPYAFGFFLDEEIGGVGSKKYIPIMNDNITALVGLDRKGSNDVALYGYDNNELTEIFEKQGYKKAFGTFTDASNIAEGCDLACVNLSIGYYNEHTPTEQIHFSETGNTLNILRKVEVINALASKQYLAEFRQDVTSYYVMIDIANFPLIEINGDELLVSVTPNSITEQQRFGNLVTYSLEGFDTEKYFSLDDLFIELAYAYGRGEPLVIDSSRIASKQRSSLRR